MKTPEQVIEEAIVDYDFERREVKDEDEAKELVERIAKEKAQELPGPAQPSVKDMKEKAERAKEIFNKSPILDNASEPFKEGVFQGIQLGLMEPVSSPSDLIVEVDGEKVGVYNGFNSKSIHYKQFKDGEKNKVSRDSCHIRLLHPQRGVVLDNRKDQ